MNIGVITSRYAKALLKFVQEKGTGENVYSQVCELVNVLKSVSKFRDYVENHPELTLQKKIGLLSAALGGPLNPELERFIGLVALNGRMEFLTEVLISFVSQYRQANDIKVGTLVVASPVDGLRERLEEILHEKTGSEVHLRERVDPELIGGFLFELGDYRLDGSVQRQFRLLERRLIEKNNRIV